MLITVKDFEEYDYVMFTDKRPKYWNKRGRMDYLLGATIPIEEIEILGKDGIIVTNMLVKDTSKRNKWIVSHRDIVALETKN